MVHTANTSETSDLCQVKYVIIDEISMAKFKMYKLTKNVRSQNYVLNIKLKEDTSVGLVSEDTLQVLNIRVLAKC